jgi:hypothetical protein
MWIFYRQPHGCRLVRAIILIHAIGCGMTRITPAETPLPTMIIR